MSKNHKTVGSLQNHLERDIVNSLEEKIFQVCQEVVEEYVYKLVYNGGNYVGNGENPYEHTMELFNSVTVGNLKLGNKYATFDIFMDSEKIRPYVRGDGEWNAHASVDPIDVAEYIPLWMEEGTSGSLYDHEPTHYMEQSFLKLDGGYLARELGARLRSLGWRVTTM